MYCTRCGAMAREDARFCSACGVRQTPESRAERAFAAMLRVLVRLVVVIARVARSLQPAALRIWRRFEPRALHMLERLRLVIVRIATAVGTVAQRWATALPGIADNIGRHAKAAAESVRGAGASPAPAFCTHCGTSVESDQRFCSACGAALAPVRRETAGQSAYPSSPSCPSPGSC